ncbi:hypothetical protein GCM10011613_28740 [Cellvibrio zantedeschiae]|uniref:Polysaccharide lyase n=1 Tax=Cellvibrio zantedeschiae TaxID=1237077 RepID=A0ABQ3B7G8_9GAMM|nr:hypothetical protein [Cellvibrio zantedeschiae]GGY82240.1 hypothetical protein GCM10011613_28740 [Cellvibrio zantedeschiae]
MKIRQLASYACGALILTLSSVIWADVIAEDNFESGVHSSLWNGFSYVSVAKLPQETGRTGYGLKMWYKGTALDTSDADAEARFDLKKEYTDLLIEFDLFIPANYKHVTPSDRAANNKFLRLWQVSYSEGEQIGAGTIPQDNTTTSIIGTDYKRFPNWGVSTAVKQSRDFITPEDLGHWMAIKIYARAPTDTSNGVLRIYKNKYVVLDDTNIANILPGTQGWRYGYLLGWANSGFREDTILYIDNVRFSDVAPPKSPGGAPSSSK